MVVTYVILRISMNESLVKRIRAFLEVRDMPFFVATQGEQDCCCITKAYLLEKKLQDLGLKYRHKLCWFKWEEIGIPAAILKVDHESLVSHQFLEVLIPETGNWALVDPTWDSGLTDVLPVNQWDGLSPTPCAVPIYRFCTDDETTRIFKARLVQHSFDKQGSFLRALNDYLAKVRTKYNNQA